MKAYYNENDRFAAAWLRQLIACGHIADGDVDERDIRDVKPSDLRGYTQCHFFAGIGVWSYALRKAGVTDDTPVWTGSCPCQPFSTAGRGDGVTDERHLWPHWFHLIEVCRPPLVFGEQVSSKDGLGWFDLVQADLEGTGYAVGGEDRCAAGYGAPHVRQRLFFGAGRVGNPASRGKWNGVEAARKAGTNQGSHRAASDADRMGDTDNEGSQEHRELGELHIRESDGQDQDRFYIDTGLSGGSRSDNHHWRDVDWLFCRDNKWRPVEPGTSPLVDGSAARVGRLRGYGNAIVAPVAQAFIEDFLL